MRERIIRLGISPEPSDDLRDAIMEAFKASDSHEAAANIHQIFPAKQKTTLKKTHTRPESPLKNKAPKSRW